MLRMILLMVVIIYNISIIAEGNEEAIQFTTIPVEFCYLQDIAPDIRQNLKYATDKNFTGRVVRGYLTGQVILTKQAAYALQAASEELKKEGLALEIFDAYRPTQAVDDFLEWCNEPDNLALKEQYYPHLSKEDLFIQGYIAPGNSSHSRGSTVDLTMIDLKTGKELDMGTPFDFFGAKAHTDYQNTAKSARVNRQKLKTVMEKYGFKNYLGEWWHYTLIDEPFKGTYFNFLVK